ncbi:PREDICTED: zinc finger MYM-type 1, partial [Prunus dulcis]
RDVSIKEQMAMGLRYVNDKGQIIERFVGVQHVTDTTSSALKEAIDEFFSSSNLSFSKLRGQGYDGASNMRAILGITNTLSLALQKKDQDIVSAMNLVKTCKENLQLMRDNEFEELVEQASSFCYKHDIIVPTMDEEYVIPRRSRRNAPMKTNYHRYRVEIFIHVIDGQLAELNDRFNE